MVHFIMKRLGFSLELCHVFPRVATEDFFVRGLKFMGFFSSTEMMGWLFGQEKGILKS